jgi:Right handed beta helix region
VSIRVSVLFWAAALSIALLAYCLSSLSYAPRAQAAYPCSGKHVYPSQNLTTVAAGSNAGTTFCIHDGTYNVSKPVLVQDNDKFIGLYDDATRPAVVTTQALFVFDANHGSNGALIKGLKISGAVGGNYCEPNCGRGIYGGTNLTVDDVWLTANKNQGIGGTGPGLLVQNSIIDHNGSYSFSNDGGPITAAGIKTMASMTVLNSTIRDNYWSGVWCDNGCDAFTVKNSILTGNGKAGIHNEISDGPSVFARNTIKGNGKLTRAPRRAGMVIVESTNVDAYGNTFGGNTQYGVHIANGTRHALRNVKFHDNTMNGDLSTGCALSGVSCYANK